jgi:hypothetical protein
MGWDGIRIATVSNPPVVLYGTALLFLNIMVKGPGQKASANFNPISGHSTVNSSNAAILAI